MRTRLALASLLGGSLLAFTACGSGGGGGVGRFPDSAPTDLVAIVADPDGAGNYQMIVSDVQGRGHVVFTEFADPTSGGVKQEGVVWSPDHRRLAYLARPDGGGLVHVFVLEPQRGQPVDILGDEIEASQLDFSFDTLEWSPDGTRLSFTATDGGGVSRVFLVDPDGSDLVDLFAESPVAGESMPGRAKWAPDSHRVAVLMSLLGTAGERVFTFLPDGAGFVDVTASPVPVENAEVHEVVWNPQSTRLLIRAEFEELDFTDAYVADPAGGADYVRVSPHTGGGDLTDASWSPDGSRIAYLSNLESGDTRREVFVVAPDGTGHLKVSGNLVAGRTVTNVFWGPDGVRLAFRSDRLTDDQFELFTVLPTGAGIVPVSLRMIADGDVAFGVDDQGRLQSPWSPDARRLAYLADDAVDGTWNAHVVDPAGSNRRPLTDGVAGCEISILRWSPDSRFLLVEGELTADGVRNAFTADAVIAGPPLQVSFATVAGASADAFDWSADGEFVAFAEHVPGPSGILTVARSSRRESLDVRDLTESVEDVDTVETR